MEDIESIIKVLEFGGTAGVVVILVWLLDRSERRLIERFKTILTSYLKDEKDNSKIIEEISLKLDGLLKVMKDTQRLVNKTNRRLHRSFDRDDNLD